MHVGSRAQHAYVTPEIRTASTGHLSMRLALYHPEIPQNAGAILRLAACFGLPLDIIEPCGFVWNDAKMRRAGMDYIQHVSLMRHQGWDHFLEICGQNARRVILLDTRGEIPYTKFKFNTTDVLMSGQESMGVPESVFQMCDAQVCIPMAPECRSLNVAMATAIVAAEALRQLGRF